MGKIMGGGVHRCEGSGCSYSRTAFLNVYGSFNDGLAGRRLVTLSINFHNNVKHSCGRKAYKTLSTKVVTLKVCLPARDRGTLTLSGRLFSRFGGRRNAMVYKGVIRGCNFAGYAKYYLYVKYGMARLLLHRGTSSGWWGRGWM